MSRFPVALIEGGPGSGHHGHGGLKGVWGGSSPGTGKYGQIGSSSPVFTMDLDDWVIVTSKEKGISIDHLRTMLRAGLGGPDSSKGLNPIYSKKPSPGEFRDLVDHGYAERVPDKIQTYTFSLLPEYRELVRGYARKVISALESGVPVHGDILDAYSRFYSSYKLDLKIIDNDIFFVSLGKFAPGEASEEYYKDLMDRVKSERKLLKRRGK